MAPGLACWRLSWPSGGRTCLLLILLLDRSQYEVKVRLVHRSIGMCWYGIIATGDGAFVCFQFYVSSSQVWPEFLMYSI